MAKDILSLEKQLMLLEHKKDVQLQVLKNDVSTFVDSIKPGNLIKMGFNDLIGGSSSSGVMNPAFSGVAGVLGTLLLDRIVPKGGSFLYKILAGVLTSGVVNDITSGENSFLKKWIGKLKEKFSKNEEVDLGELFNETASNETFPEDLNNK